MGKRRFSSIDEFEGWLDRTAPERFSRSRTYAAGKNFAALHDAIIEALERNRESGEGQPTVTIERWVLEAVLLDVVRPALRTLPGTKRNGRKGVGRWADEWKRDQIDWRRFVQVYYRSIARWDHDEVRPQPKEARRRRRQTEAGQRENAERYRREGKPSVYDDHRGFEIDPTTPYPWTSTDNSIDPDVFEAVSRIFEGSPEKGDRQQIKKSWERVTVALQRGQGWRYYPSRWVRWDARQILGDDVWFTRP